MYNKNLSEDLRLRLTQIDMDFLKNISKQRECSVSEVIRSIIGEYRRSIEAVQAINRALEMVNNGGAGRGVTKTNFNDKL